MCKTPTRCIYVTVCMILLASSPWMHAQQVSTICSFNIGPKAGTTHDYAPLNALPVGSPCQDGADSSGVIAARTGLTSTSSSRSKLSSICSFTAGPRAGTWQDYAPRSAIPVGSPCQDGGGSTGIVIAAMGSAGSLTSAGGNVNSLAGDWEGVLGGRLPLVFHFREDGTGTVDSPSQNAEGMLLTYQITGALISVSMPSVRATFTATQTDSQLSGKFFQNGGAAPLILTPTATNETPASNSSEEVVLPVDGNWYGTIAGRIPVVFHFKADGTGTSDSPTQNSYGMPLSYTSTHDTITITIPSVGATYTAAPDGDRMAGLFTQHGQASSLTLKKD
jgi:hypothetical protein